MKSKANSAGSEAPKAADTPKAIVTLNPISEDIISMYDQFKKETDRGCALCGAAILDELLGRLFLAKLLDVKTSRKLLGIYKPLSTFSARADVAYCLGWIDRNMHTNIDAVRDIRNSFAHVHHAVTFESEKIKLRCSELLLPNTSAVKVVGGRNQFVLAVSIIAFSLEYLVARAERVSPPALETALRAVKHTDSARSSAG